MKLFYLLISFFSFVHNCYSLDPKRINFGIKTGSVISSFWGNGIDKFEKKLSQQVSNLDPDMLLNLTIAGTFSYSFIPDFFDIQGELQYLRLGKKWDFNLQSATEVSLTVYTDYLAMPVLFKLLIPLNTFVLPAVYAGPALFVQLRSRAHNISTIPLTEQPEFLQNLGSANNISNEVSNFDFGFQTGMSLNFLTRPGSIILDFRFSFGAINTFITDGGEDIRNSFFSIMVGFVFR